MYAPRNPLCMRVDLWTPVPTEKDSCPGFWWMLFWMFGQGLIVVHPRPESALLHLIRQRVGIPQNHPKPAFLEFFACLLGVCRLFVNI